MSFEDQPLRPTGSPQEASQSMEALVRRVRLAVRRSCPPFLVSQADDIAQDVLVQLLRKLERTEGKADFSSIYLLKAAHGVTVDEIRRRCRRREQTGMERAMLGNHSSAPDPERHALSRSLGQEIRRCLETVVPPRRAAVTLHLLGCAVPEIATRLQCSEKSADNRLYRGMKNLRDCLTGKGLRP